jgi:hypothetical protein
MARSQLPEATVAQGLPCQRWGVCDAGTADRWAVALQTVHRFQRLAAPRAYPQQQQAVPPGDVTGVPRDAAHAKRRRRRTAWSQTALVRGSGCLLGVDVGPRTQDPAATLMAQVVARVRILPLCLTDGWQASPAALLQGVGVV